MKGHLYINAFSGVIFWFDNHISIDIKFSLRTNKKIVISYLAKKKGVLLAIFKTIIIIDSVKLIKKTGDIFKHIK